MCRSAWNGMATRRCAWRITRKHRAAGVGCSIACHGKSVDRRARTRHADEQAASGIFPGRHGGGLGDAARLPSRHPAKNSGQRSRRDTQDGQPHAPVALRARRLHHQSVRARPLGGGLSVVRRPHRRQRCAGTGRRKLCGPHLCLPPAGRPPRAFQVQQRLHAVRDPLLRREQAMSVLAAEIETRPLLRPFLAAQAQFAAGSDSPRAFLERCLQACDAWEPKIGAFVNVNVAGARAAADASTQRWRDGRPLSAIDGMPLGIKDIIETIDMPTEMGSPLFAGWRSHRDAAAVVALREAGAVILAKTVTTEFAAREPRGTRNPWDLARTPGGSSSGSAAAVAAGMVSAALGTQVIGSTIRPASFCGCYGFKPTLGALNRGGSHDNLSQSCTGMLAADLGDAWQVAREIAVRAGGDPGYPGLNGPDQAPPPHQPQRLAALETPGWRVAEPGARQHMAETIARLTAAGVEVLTRAGNDKVAAADEAIADANSISGRINDWEGRWPLNDYRALIHQRDSIRQAYAALAAHCDGCITLSAPGPAPLGLASTGDASFAVSASLLGVPAISLPLFRLDGLPLGLQVMGFAHRDAAAMAVAAWIERTLS